MRSKFIYIIKLIIVFPHCFYGQFSNTYFCCGRILCIWQNSPLLIFYFVNLGSNLQLCHPGLSSSTSFLLFSLVCQVMTKWWGFDLFKSRGRPYRLKWHRMKHTTVSIKMRCFRKVRLTTIL